LTVQLVSACASVFRNAPPPNLPRVRGRSRDSLPACGEGWGGGAMFKSLCKDTYTNRRASVHKKTAVDPLLKVPPASRGNRTPARFPSRSGGNLKEGGNCKLCPCDWYYSVWKRSFRPTLKLTLQHSTQRSRGWGQKNTPSPVCGRGVGSEGKQTPLSHTVGEGLRVRVMLIPIARSEFMNCPPPLGSPRFARGTEPRVHAVPPACRGNLKEGVFSCARFHKLCPRGWYYFLRRRRPSKPAKPAPSATILAGSGTNTVKHWL
jgi:hypothetical protein